MHRQRHISLLIKPVSATCNMRCRYCFYFDVAAKRENPQFPLMSKEVAHTLIERVCAEENVGDISFSFQGGEPALAGLSFFEDFVAHVNICKANQRIHYALQTNGTKIDEDWAQFFKEYNFLVGISLDLVPHVHNHLRLDTQLNGTYEKVLAAYKLLKEAGVQTNVLCVLSDQLSKQAHQVMQTICDNDIDYVQFIPCLPPLEAEDTCISDEALSAQDFYSFYREFTTLWLAELKKGRYISVGLLEDIMLLTQRKRPCGCGMLGACANQLVVEGNGNVYPCDFYALDKYCLGSIKDMSISELYGSSVAKAFIEERTSLPKICTACPFKPVCCGNCKRMSSVYIDGDFCGYQRLLSDVWSPLRVIATRLIG